MRSIRIAAVIAGAALPLSLTAVTPAEAGVPEDTELVGTPESTLGMYNDNVNRQFVPAPDTVTYEADLMTDPGGSPVEGASVTLERRLPGGPWQTEKVRTTNSSGHAQAKVQVESNAKYRWVYAGDLDHEASTSNVMDLEAMRDLNAAAEQAAGNKVRFFGNVNPGWGNKRIVLFKRVNNGPWQAVDQKQTGNNGSWSFRVGFPPNVGTDWFWRTVIDAQGPFEISISAGLRTFTTPGRVHAGF